MRTVVTLTLLLVLPAGALADTTVLWCEKIVDVETSEIIHVATASDDRENLFRIVQEIAQKVLADLKFPPLSGEIEAARTGRNVPTDAVTFYGRALWYHDQDEPSRAAEFYRRALGVFPNYTEAQEGLRGINPS